MLGRITYIIFTSLSVINVVNGFSGGAPDGACSGMTPGHGVSPQTGTPPYTVSTSESSVSAGQSLQVTISSKDRHSFKGFFIRARQNGQYLPGTFSVQDGTMRLRCNGQGITHRGAIVKQSQTVEWTAPDNLSGPPIEFVATVVEQKLRFWTFIPSSPLKVVAGGVSGGGSSGGGSVDGGGQTATSNVTITGNPKSDNPMGNVGAGGAVAAGGGDGDDGNNSGSHNAKDWQDAGNIILHSECGKTRGCFHDCLGSFCSFVVYWMPKNDSVLINMAYKLTSHTEQWFSLGLSHDEMMGDDSVMECVMERGKVLVKTSYNTGKYNDYPDDKHAALSEYHGMVKDGILSCQFVRKVSYPREPKVFDLHSSYYLFVATGEAVSGNKFPHSYDNLPVVSKSKISLLHLKEVEKGLGILYPMVKTHATAMILAWVLFANIGVFVSRHGRKMFTTTAACGKNVWFNIHRFCMTMTLFLTLVGFLLILIESRGRSHIPQLPGKSYVILHPPIGLIVIILTIVNPLMALFRPDPSSPSRPMFKWTHWGFGVFAWFVSFIVLTIGLNLQKAHAEIEAVYVMFAFMGYSFVMEIFIRVIPFTCGAMGYCCKKLTCGRRDSYDFSMELRPSEVAGETSLKEANAELNRITRTENTVTSVMIVLHIIACIGFTVGVLYFSLRRSVSHIIDNY